MPPSGLPVQHTQALVLLPLQEGLGLGSSSISLGWREGEGKKKKKRKNELSTSLPFKAGICPAMDDMFRSRLTWCLLGSSAKKATSFGQGFLLTPAFWGPAEKQA